MSGEKKKMSKGCIVSLIVVGVLIVAVAIGGFLCYKNVDKFVEMGLTSMTSEVHPYLPEEISKEEVDEQVSRFMDAFREKRIGDVELQSIMLMGKDVLENIQKKEISEEEIKKKALEFYEELKRIGEK